jgi:hypothetical protein
MTEAGCIFCGRSPQTKTHVFRKAWIKRLMVPAAPGPYEMIQGSSEIAGAQRESNWPTDEFGMAPGAACDPCNSGWMDKIDHAAERIVEPMVIGQRCTIRSYHEQKAVARWVSQVAILIDQSQVVQVIPPGMIRQFYDSKEPFSGMIVWLARTSVDWSVEAWERAWIMSSGTPPEPVSDPNMCLFTLRIVELVVQALVPLNDRISRTVGVTRGDNMRFLKQLWPSRYTPVSWPPNIAIRSDTLASFAASFEPPGTKPGDLWSSTPA